MRLNDVCYRVDFESFLDVIRFAGQRRLVHLEVVALQNDAVGREKVAIFDLKTNI
jgi:hypothetical protein